MLEEWGRGEWIKFGVSVVLGAQILAYVLKTWIFNGKSGKVPPGELGWPLWDETLNYLSSCADSRSPGKWIDEKRALYGDVFKARLFGVPTVFALGSAGNRWVLSNDQVLFRQAWPKSMRTVFGQDSVLVAHGEKFRHLRLHIEQFLGTEAVKRFIGSMESCTLSRLERWQQQQQDVKVYPELHEHTFKVALELIMGGAPEVNFHKMEQNCLVLGLNMFSVPINLPWTRFGKAMKAQGEILKVFNSEIRRRRAEWYAGLSPLGKGGRLSSNNLDLARDLLDLFMFWETDKTNSQQKEWEFTDTEIAQNMLVVIEGAHGTTAATLTNAMYYLSTRPHIVQELRKEVLSVAEAKKADEPLSWAEIRNMTYTRNVLLETLRMRTTVPQLNKETVQDLEFEGFTIPKGWVVTCCPRQTHNREENFPNPELFDPSRFNQSPDLYSFIPFGRGPRMCPGEKFGMTVMQVFLYHLVAKFDWELVDPEEQFTMFFAPTPKNGLPVKLTPRKLL
ncbi:protein MpCYP818A1 [Marchantia polymorpha subsp. ruderalis]|uniref:Cytochrome P450 n=2 Tax=Marchantia polymorpha TaxID=3197 RepID=A0A176WHS3_MARPO|nr:hypothetical protein AXG93_3218s1160 [Marchantia polymorpha subsp. ruderalis]PTQ46829.1 hypothetical protein MARPO_0010s0197 [Marchantia polymorpha]BBN12751.1 hypothetical protein Mp_5g22590 [Marchantia polymorpha subsp. ruderalis]|eukprot:PTQ46829.1 hypothetical protein MARPO_0010s0197 [Marchantia polymorpha]